MSSGRAAALLLVLTAAPALAQAPDGSNVFQSACATCHTTSPADGRTPALGSLRALTSEAILAALTTGPMRAQGDALSDAERRAVATDLGRAGTPAAATATPVVCSTTPPIRDPAAGPSWIGWGNGLRNTRFQPANEAELTAAQVPRLTLKWAFGFPAARSGRSQPTVGGGRLLVAGEGGEVFSLDPDTGCLHWIFRAQAGVRTSITIGTFAGEGAEGPYAAYFADGRANVYAVDLLTGQQLWTRRVDDHPSAGVTGSPVFDLGRLYVPVAGIGEEIQAGNAAYECCTFRGSVAAIDANTGDVLWKTYTVPDAPARRGENPAGTARWGPSGGGVWSAPTLDLERRVLYVGTGNAYSGPPQPYTDAVLALDLRTGGIQWAFQATPGDVWNLACTSGGGNCPPESGPDFDFGSSPMLVTRPGGGDLVIAGQKSGMAYALDPDAGGELVWEYRAGQGSMAGGIQWGPAADPTRAYFAVSDSAVGPAEAGGLHAVDIATGQQAWYTPPPPPACGTLGPQCHGAQSAAVSVMPGIVFSGSSDGAMRAFDSETGAVVWTYDTNRAFPTVNGVPATGGSIDGPGPVVAGGMLFFNSGYAFGRPGNVLLAFGVD
jgi:polyvinyl alcohol dehydrogenase (cytochrome)